MHRPIFQSSRITWGGLVVVYLGWTLTYVALKYTGHAHTSLGYSDIFLSGLSGSVFLLLISFIESKLRKIR